MNTQINNNEKSDISFLKALIFPFYQKYWIGRLWWVFLIAFIPILDLIVFRGWRVNVVNRICNREELLLPSLKGIIRYLADGIILYFMTFIYLIPVIILVAIEGISEYQFILEILWWLYEKIFTDKQVPAFEVVFGKSVMSLSFAVAAPIVYLLIIGPIYRAGMIRYSVTGHISSFFLLHKNIILVFSNLSDFVVVLFLEIFTWMLIYMILIPITSSILVATGIGITLIPLIVIPFFLSMGFWTTGHLFGQLGLKLTLQSQ